MGFWHPFQRVRPLGPNIPTSTQPCTLHREHRPGATYTEIHHVVPRGFQRAWTPLSPPFPGEYAGQQLWDARTDPICRTGHGNVHFWLVRLMREIAASVPAGPVRDQSIVPVAAASVLKAVAKGQVKPTPPDLAEAQQAPIRFMAVGGDLRTLFDADEWGEI